ncbi:hypothetical protein B0H11DRAFT_1114766 [Mycena galericulata]|nr:hypothetical protein B0H11DRAFT_1114766 [Mycena galericulata]
MIKSLWFQRLIVLPSFDTMLWLHYLLAINVVFLGHCVNARLTNHTIDDSDPSVMYTHTPIIQCNATACPGFTKGLFNGTSTLTESPIVVSFTVSGSALYIYLNTAGVCIFTIDGADVGDFNNSLPNYKPSIQLAYHNTFIPDGHHVLMISPAENTTLLEFDYLIYTSGQTSAPRGIRVGAIVGGVLGGVALVLALLIAAFLLRWRERQRKLYIRGVPLSEDDKTSIRMNQMAGKS